MTAVEKNDQGVLCRNGHAGYWVQCHKGKYSRSYCRYCKHDREANERYGLPPGEYYSITSLPCGLCGTLVEPRVVDHDHETGKVRGALCRVCNMSLGVLEARGKPWVQRALAYLDRRL